MNAEILTIGNEVLTGLVSNSNAAFLGERLTRIGFDVRWVTTVGDREDDIRRAVADALGRADAVVMTGGLGPTSDDLTRQAVASFLGAKLRLVPEALVRIEETFRRLGRTMAASNRAQAEVPEGAEVLDNPAGLALGFAVSRNGRRLFALPGVPSEMRRMTDESVLPRLAPVAGMESRCRILRTFGIPESELCERLDGFSAAFPSVRIGFFPDATDVKVRLLAFEPSADGCETAVASAEAFVRERAGRWIYGEGEDTLESVAGRLLRERGLTLGVAESCTGGLICHRITNVAGSSAYFLRGAVTYANSAKQEMLGVRPETLAAHGAVSAECAAEMAEGVRRIAGADLGLAATGIAGPGGGTPSKPVGLVFLACADRSGTEVERRVFVRDRLWHKERAAAAALDLCRRRILALDFIR
jgi:nicotinamide-nucleotide amidase